MAHLVIGNQGTIPPRRRYWIKIPPPLAPEDPEEYAMNELTTTKLRTTTTTTTVIPEPLHKSDLRIPYDYEYHNYEPTSYDFNYYYYTSPYDYDYHNYYNTNYDFYYYHYTADYDFYYYYHYTSPYVYDYRNYYTTNYDFYYHEDYRIIINYYNGYSNNITQI
ncbi:hypothetical protein Ciccas_012332 [Cichlidogyrus casuarinus]|uniref:Uncharacterized protein n=1 Tax=Cichlidogyrus casuarinus TaxID=1844966 RepID=A0ABD2PP59_9PLAT